MHRRWPRVPETSRRGISKSSCAMRPRSSATWVTIMYDFPPRWSDMITHRVILDLQGEGDQNFVPDVPESFLHAICAVSPAALDLCKQCGPAICASTPSHLGYPSRIAQSSYYVGQVQITREEIDQLAPLLVKANIRPRHSRVCKDLDETGAHVVFNILQASVDKSDSPEPLGTLSNGAPVTSTKGDHSLELDKINTHLRAARQVTDHPLRVEFLSYYERYFQTGDMGLFDNAQRVWMKDKQPRVETFFGFNHKYRDPAGARAEFQGFVGLLDSDGSRELNALQQDAQKYIATLPWVDGLQGQGGANGPFEMDEFQAPDFNAVYALAYAATNIFTGLSMPAFCDNWIDYAWKNLMVKTRDQALRVGELSQGEPAWFIAEAERTTYLQHVDQSVTFKVALHELFGHGTGKLLSQLGPDEYNFDIKNPPMNPLTGTPITSWYSQEQRTSSVFGEMDMSLEECRAEAIAAYLAFDKGILSTMGYSDSSDITADDCRFSIWQEQKERKAAVIKWTSAHDRARFGILRTLMAADNFMRVVYEEDPPLLTVHIDRARLESIARPAISTLMTKLHVWRCSADGPAATDFYGQLTEVDGVWLRIREVVVDRVKNQAPRLFVQANTILEEGTIDSDTGPRVRVVEYDTTVEGVIQSWCEREV
ncbi:predicted protein [Aspergillus terreus NIH2624]|uniref:Dipeptidyl peptidase III n=1 Tax=Aspergillus terreus (strain NIH 2624 / FGSC A1156) TaxID=341663 RepID=Q0CEW8_ASPTN|nr:uncharacterized protein ATEG_07766 [Aspergillus terreus NIH2624]EAU32028.1 predicted protein [Aspergillus terreus NIH2624]